ncbi:MAG TPA: SPOR domain-containing protein [Syntrophales bacterium]|nr:SPOR domain-containing protein [Syntrophales bacterium]
MEKESLKESELEHELEALYHEVASETCLLPHIEESESPAGVTLPSQTEEPPSIEQKKRKVRLSFIAALAVISFLLLVVAAVFFWPTVQRYYATDTVGKIYSQRINKQAGKSVIVPPVGDTKPKGQTEIISITDSSKTSNGKKYSIQIRAYPENEKTAAAEFVSDLRRIHPDTRTEKANIRGRGVWYRILIGHFANIEEASTYMKEKKVLDMYPGSFIQVISEGRS